MIFFLIVGVLVGAVTVIFALQNIAVVAVSFLFWNVHASLAILLVIAAAAGVLISLLISVPESVKKSFAMVKVKNQLAATEASLKEAQAQVADLNAKLIQSQAETRVEREKNLAATLPGATHQENF